jgi:hypothetical protein
LARSNLFGLFFIEVITDLVLVGVPPHAKRTEVGQFSTASQQFGTKQRELLWPEREYSMFGLPLFMVRLAECRQHAVLSLIRVPLLVLKFKFTVKTGAC